MMDVASLRGWLLWNPRPATVRVLTADDRNHEVSVTSGVSWMAIATSIHALDPVLVEAYDADGKIIRAVRPKEEGKGDAGGPAAPLVLPPGTDPASVQLLHFADLIAAAYRHSTDVAFERLASLFEASNRRSEALERSLDATHKVLVRMTQQSVEAAAEKETSPLEEIVSGFMQGQGAAHGVGETNGKAG